MHKDKRVLNRVNGQLEVDANGRILPEVDANNKIIAGQNKSMEGQVSSSVDTRTNASIDKHSTLVDGEFKSVDSYPKVNRDQSYEPDMTVRKNQDFGPDSMYPNARKNLDKVRDPANPNGTTPFPTNPQTGSGYTDAEWKSKRFIDGTHDLNSHTGVLAEYGSRMDALEARIAVLEKR